MEIGEERADVNNERNGSDTNERLVKQVTARRGCDGGSCDSK